MDASVWVVKRTNANTKTIYSPLKKNQSGENDAASRLRMRDEAFWTADGTGAQDQIDLRDGRDRWVVIRSKKSDTSESYTGLGRL